MSAPLTETTWEEQEGPYRVLRGGARIYSPRYCRSASRYYLPFDHKNFYIGFRIALSHIHLPQSDGFIGDQFP